MKKSAENEINRKKVPLGKQNDFRGFFPETGDFFWELVLNNDRTWFQEHKESFETLLNRPFKALAEKTTEIFLEESRLPGLDCHASRIYRDARRLFGRGPYKESLWFSIRNRDIKDEGPSFFFEISPKGWCYGMGIYCPSASQMEQFRKSIAAEPERFRRLAEKINGMPEFIIEGEEYKRPKGSYGDAVDMWYNKKWVSVICNEDFGGKLFSSELPEFLASEFIKLVPMYKYLSEYMTGSGISDLLP